MELLAVALMVSLVVAGAWSLGRAAAGVGPRRSGTGDESVTVTAGWAVEAFGPEAAFDLARRGAAVVDGWREELDAVLRSAADELRTVRVVWVRAEVGAGEDSRLVMGFADGTELDAGALEFDDEALELAWVSGRAEVELVSMSVDGAVAVVVVAGAGRRWEVRARELEVRR